MRIKALLCVVGLIAAGTAGAHGNNFGKSGVLFVFDGGIGVQPFRSQAGARVILAR